MAGPRSLYRFVLPVDRAQDGQIDSPAPAAIQPVRTRVEVRQPAPPQTVLRLRGAGDRPVAWQVLDVSRRGLCFAPSASFRALSEGNLLKGAIVEWNGRMRVLMNLRVRHVSETFDGRRVAGAEIEFDSHDEARHWRTEVDALADTTMRADGSWTREIWELFEHSGYFSLSNKHPSEFEHLREAFEISSRKLERAPELATQIVWPSVRGVESSMSLIALNHHSIFFYHLARRRGNPPAGATGKTILHDVYARGLAWIAARDYAKWLVAWVQDAGDFSKRLHLDFARQHLSSGRVAIVPFRPLEIATRLVSETRVSMRGAKRRSPGWTVRATRFEDVPIISAALKRRFHPSYIEGLALEPMLGRQRSAWDDTGLLHGRDVVVAERDGEIGAVAFLECAEDGIHFFGLLDVVRIVEFGDHPGVRETLLNHAKEMFAQIGKRMFLYAAEPDLPSEQWPAGAVDLGLTHCLVMPTDLVPRFADQVWELTMGAPE